MSKRGWKVGIAITIAVVSTQLTGCEPSTRGTVTGTVKLQGELADHGTIAFHPVQGGVMAHGRIESDGSYRLVAGASDSGRIMQGEYVVTVVIPQEPRPATDSGPPPPMMRLSSQKFAEKNSSPLRGKIVPGANVLHFDVTVADDFEQQIEGIRVSEDRSAGTDNELEGPLSGSSDEGGAVAEGDDQDEGPAGETEVDAEPAPPTDDSADTDDDREDSRE